MLNKYELMNLKGYETNRVQDEQIKKDQPVNSNALKLYIIY